MTKIKKTDNTKCWRGYKTTGILTHCWRSIKCYNHIRELQATYIYLYFHSVIPLSEIHAHKYTCTRIFVAALCLIHNNPKLETTQMFINRSKDKQIVVYLHTGILINNKKKKPTDTHNMDVS